MMAMTTSSSISVKPRAWRRGGAGFIGKTVPSVRRTLASSRISRQAMSKIYQSAEMLIAR